MIKVNEVKQLDASYELVLDSDDEGKGETFKFDIIFDRGEWVLQGATVDNNRGIRYSQTELEAILKILKEKNAELKNPEVKKTTKKAANKR